MYVCIHVCIFSSHLFSFHLELENPRPWDWEYRDLLRSPASSILRYQQPELSKMRWEQSPINSAPPLLGGCKPPQHLFPLSILPPLISARMGREAGSGLGGDSGWHVHGQETEAIQISYSLNLCLYQFHQGWVLSEGLLFNYCLIWFLVHL